MSIFTNFSKVAGNVEAAVVADFDSWWDGHVKPVLTTDIEPVLKKFLKQFGSQFGAQAVTAALGGVAALSTGTPFAVVTTSLATTLLNDATTDAGADATLDATQVLQTIQSALQVAKIANDVVTPSDQKTVDAIASAGQPAPAPSA